VGPTATRYFKMYGTHMQIMSTGLIILSTLVTFTTTSNPYNGSLPLSFKRGGVSQLTLDRSIQRDPSDNLRLRRERSKIGRKPPTHMKSTGDLIPHIPINTRNASIPLLYPSPNKVRGDSSLKNPVHDHVNSPDASKNSPPRKSLTTVPDPTDALRHLMTSNLNRRSVGRRSSMAQNMLRRLLQDIDGPVRTVYTPPTTIHNASGVHGPRVVQETAPLALASVPRMVLGVDIPISPERYNINNTVTNPYINGSYMRNNTVTGPYTDAWTSETEIPWRTYPPEVDSNMSDNDDIEFFSDSDEDEEVIDSYSMYYKEIFDEFPEAGEEVP
jgi:hypothetical protein